MAELVKIPFATSEYHARFERPYIAFIGLDRPRAFEAVFTALLPFNIHLENTEVLVTGTPADHRTIFRIPERGIRFEFGAEEYKFTKEQANWSTVEADGQILLAAERALMEGNDVNIASCIVTVAMHLQLLAKSREELLAPFFPDPFKIFLTQRQTQTHGSHLRFADGDVLLDFSVAFANGIFLRFSSQFTGHPPLAEVQTKVRSDQDMLFGILGVEEATNA
jgi:hypothetical protein